jgi:hypothetical protein
MSSRDKLKKLLATVAPALGAAIGGPYGGIAGKFIAEKLGAPEADTAREQLELLEKKPELLLQLKQIDKDFEKHMASVGVDIFKAEVEDRKDARAHNAATRSKTPAVLSWLIVLFNFGVIGFLLAYGTPDGLDPMLLGRLLGTLDLAFGMVLNYWLGSSHGSRSKDAAIAPK